MIIRIEDLHNIYQSSKGISIDSRSLQAGQLFFAIRGDRFDGHNYIDQALEAGAAHCVVDRMDLASHCSCVFVPNVLTALHRLAHFHRRLFPIPIIGVTGTNGKTTTKELLLSILSQKFNVIATQGNLNNHIGVPLTLLRLSKSTEIAIIEMGANSVGEISWLCHLANPTHGVVTNIGKAHLQGYGNVDGVRRTKYELYQYLAGHSGVLFHNAEEPSLDRLPMAFEELCSFNRANFVGQLERIQFDQRGIFIQISITGSETYLIKSNLYGKYNQQNILTSLAIGSFFGLNIDQLSQGLQNYRPANNRSQLITKGSRTFYLDAYNANPSSMSHALSFFDTVEGKQKILILGDMLELGRDGMEEHRKILEMALKISNLVAVFLVGPSFSEVLKSYPRSEEKVKSFRNVMELKNYLNEVDMDSSHILIKGSRGLQLEKVISEAS